LLLVDLSFYYYLSFFLNDTTTTEIYTLSYTTLFRSRKVDNYGLYGRIDFRVPVGEVGDVYDRYYIRVLEMREAIKILNQALRDRSEEHTSELQSRGHLVCRLLLEKKKKNIAKKYSIN